MLLLPPVLSLTVQKGPHRDPRVNVNTPGFPIEMIFCTAFISQPSSSAFILAASCSCRRCTEVGNGS